MTGWAWCVKGRLSTRYMVKRFWHRDLLLFGHLYAKSLSGQCESAPAGQLCEAAHRRLGQQYRSHHRAHLLMPLIRTRPTNALRTAVYVPTPTCNAPQTIFLDSVPRMPCTASIDAQLTFWWQLLYSREDCRRGAAGQLQRVQHVRAELHGRVRAAAKAQSCDRASVGLLRLLLRWAHACMHLEALPSIEERRRGRAAARVREHARAQQGAQQKIQTAMSSHHQTCRTPARHPGRTWSTRTWGREGCEELSGKNR